MNEQWVDSTHCPSAFFSGIVGNLNSITATLLYSSAFHNGVGLSSVGVGPFFF